MLHNTKNKKLCEPFVGGDGKFLNFTRRTEMKSVTVITKTESPCNPKNAHENTQFKLLIISLYLRRSVIFR